MATDGRPPAGDAEPPIDPRLIALAREALLARMSDDFPATTAAVESLYGEFGSDGVKTAMLAWTDTLTAHAYPAATPGEPVEIAWQGQDKTGRRGPRHQDTESVSYGHRFAARFVLARHHDDKAAAEMLLDTAIKDGRETECVGGLLDVAAYTLRTALAGEQMVTPRGRAL